MSQMLSDEDLERLTGYNQRSRQQKWLDSNRIFYRVNDKNLVVTWQWVNDSKELQSPSDQLPNFGALNAG